MNSPYCRKNHCPCIFRDECDGVPRNLKIHNERSGEGLFCSLETRI